MAPERKPPIVRKCRGPRDDARRPSVEDPDIELPAPPGATATTVRLGDDEYLIVSMPAPTWDVPNTLTDAERAVVEAVLRGLTNDEVARARGTSVNTIANQLTSIFTKLGVTSRIELAHRLRKKRSR